MPAVRLGELAREVFGVDRVTIEQDLADAIAEAVAQAESDVDTGLSGVGVLITGSIFTVADARKLLRR
jgi:dihydrofolate synthase/folylpolyglutamate synthase